ncbi:UNVERIFIED_CONTAM: hypothetical protein Slati_3100800 [Sesamum latifolium]|uniref:Uncharacterized protein n=1 Tax=Sesamum latifolium TaxID=2727402 RepID=A0AAW2UVJ7_9LAMI
MVDSFTFLKWANPQRIRKNTEKYLERLLGFASEIVKDREKQSGKVKKRKDFLDTLDEKDDIKVEEGNLRRN